VVLVMTNWESAAEHAKEVNQKSKELEPQWR
jgi:hypothetical protein